MTVAARECDVVVIGGGPAGATAAQLLASWGRSVVVLQRPTAAHLTLAESLPASTRKLLRFIGQLERVDAAGFYPNRGNIASWAGHVRITTSPDAGFHVPRAAFDAVLREGARDTGATIVEATVQSVSDGEGAAVTALDADGHANEWRAQYVLDCSGRAGVVARRGLRRADARYRTLAIVAEWECDAWPADERPYTTIESYAGGWAWSVPLSATRRQCTVMIDPPSLARRSLASFGVTRLDALYATDLVKATALSVRLAGARQVSAPWTCDASIYDSVRAADGRKLLVGDACSFIEPLSSAGVKKALLSAWRATVVCNTCLANSGMASTAIDLYVRREREVFAACARRSAAFFAEAAAVFGTPFWRARADAAAAHENAIGSGDHLDDDEALAFDPSVLAAFERLRSAERVRFKPADALRFAAVATIAGREIVLRDALLVPGGRAPLQFAAGIDLPRLARIASEGDDVPAIIEAYQRDVGPVPVSGVLTGLSLLVARQALVTEESTS